jgi:hypothetical protein
MISRMSGSDCELGFDMLGSAGEEVEGEITDRQPLPNLYGFVGPMALKGKNDEM